MLSKRRHAQQAENPVSPVVVSAGPACKLFAEHAASMLRVLDAKTFRGDVSEKIQVRSASSHYQVPPDEIESLHSGSAALLSPLGEGCPFLVPLDFVTRPEISNSADSRYLSVASLTALLRALSSDSITPL